MSKLSKQDKIDIYNERKKGTTIPFLVQKYQVNKSIIKYLIRLINYHGVKILDKTGNNKYSSEFKTMLVNKILIENQSITSISIQYGLPNQGLLSNWIKQFKENNGIIEDKPKGRKSTMKAPKKPYNQMTDAEKLKFLEEQNSYLQAENAYLKKLDALIQQKKKSKQQKKY